MTDNTIIDASTQTMRCNVCGDEVPIPMGILKWAATVMRAFALAHRSPKHPPGQTQFSVPRAGGLSR